MGSNKTEILNKSDSGFWHLGRDEFERSVSRLELAIFHVYESIERWEKECISAVEPGQSIAGHDSTLLHSIRSYDRPKGVSELAQFLNRDDIANIQYSLRKMQKSGLIQKSKESGSRKDMTYEVTEYGRQLTDGFGDVRTKVLINSFRQASFDKERIDELADLVILLVGLYESSGRSAMMERLR
ncbi:MAG: winged helix DNA-binding protein [Pseudomonadales bacterium]